MKAPAQSAFSFIPEGSTLEQLREAAAGCRGCDLYAHATQTVFGEGPENASIVLVGEQPGDREDLEGHPFVGPAGALLRRALHDAGIDPETTYITNAVKHFKFVERGKRRIHAKPKTIEIRACRPWLEAELTLLRPSLVVALGATAAQTLLGADFRVTQHRGEILSTELASRIVATVHPSSILRAADEETRDREYADFVEDLKFAASLVA